MSNKVQKYIQHLADQAPTYSYTAPQEIDKPDIQKSLQDQDEYEKGKRSSQSNSEQKCKPGYKW